MAEPVQASRAQTPDARRDPRGARHRVTPDLSARIAALGTLPVAELMRAALRCASEADFLELCAGRTNRAE